MNNNGNTGSDFEATKLVLRYNSVPMSWWGTSPSFQI